MPVPSFQLRVGLVRRESSAILATICVLGGGLGLVGSVGTEPLFSENCETDSACLALYEQAQVQSKAGRLTEALRSYKLAYETQHNPRLLYSVARLLHRLAQGAEAVSYYQRFVDSNVDDPAQKDKAREYVSLAHDTCISAITQTADAGCVRRPKASANFHICPASYICTVP